VFCRSHAEKRTPMTESKTCVIIESVAAWRYVESLDPAYRVPVWMTTSPYVAERLQAEGRTVVCPDEDVPQDEADRVGYFALRSAHRIGVQVDEQTKGWPDGLHPGRAMEGTLHRLLTALFYKALLLDRCRKCLPKEARLVTVGRSDLSPVTGFEVMVNRFDTLFAVLAKALGYEVIEFDALRPTGALPNGDFLQPSWRTRLVTVLNAPFSAPLFRTWLALWKGKPFRLTPARKGLHLFIYKPNELVEEIFLGLAMRGVMIEWAPRFLKPQPRAATMATSDKSSGWAGLAEGVQHLCKEEAEREGFRWHEAFSAAAVLAAERMVRALSFGRAAAANVPAYCAELKRRGRGMPVAVLTNALTTPLELFIRQGLVAADIPVYMVEHGVSVGLSPLHLACYNNGILPDVTGNIYFNRCQKAAEADGRPLPDHVSAVVGTPRVIRNIGLRCVQRLAVRRMFQATNRLIVYVTGLYPNNHQRLPHYWRDMPYHRIRRQIVYEVLDRCRDTVVLKLYPTYRYVDGDPFAELLPLPPNCRAVQFTDFRNLRAAADVLIIDTPSSGLGWTWSTGVPQIYLETGMYTLLPEIAEGFRRALFYVDVREPGWEIQLARLLALPHAELVAQYEAKAEARRRVGEYCILGPEGDPGRLGAGFLLDDHARRRAQAGSWLVSDVARCEK